MKEIGYHQLFSRQAVVSPISREFDVLPIHDMSTLMIAGGDDTDSGVKVPVAGSQWKQYAAVATIAAVIVAGALLVYRGYDAASTPSSVAAVRVQTPTIVILPFSSEDPSADIGVGLADALTTRLGNIKSLRMMSASAGRRMATMDPRHINRDYGVTYLLRGNLTRSGGNAALQAEFLDIGNGAVVWSETFPATSGDLFAVQTKLAERIWQSLGVDPLPDERQQVSRSFTSNTEAYKRYLLGRYLLADRSTQNIQRSIDAFKESTDLDPGFALGYVGLADAYALLNLYMLEPPKDAYIKSSENALKALAIDPELAEAHTSLAYVKFFYQRDRPSAELEFRRAIQANPSYSQAHHWFALALAGMGRTTEAASEAEAARRLDPLSLAVQTAEGLVEFYGGDSAAAVSQCAIVLSNDPNFGPALKVQRWAQVSLGDRGAAIGTLEAEINANAGETDDPGWIIPRVEATDPSTDRGLALKLAAAAGSPSIKRNDYAFSYEIALAWNNLGQTAKALDYLERAEAARSHNFNYLEFDPRFVNLHQEPRYKALISKLQ